MNLPIRARLTAWYAALLAAIIVALGAFLVVRLRSDLQAAVDRDVAAAGQDRARLRGEGAGRVPRGQRDRAAPRAAPPRRCSTPSGHVLSPTATPFVARRSCSAGARGGRARGPAASSRSSLGPDGAALPGHGDRRCARLGRARSRRGASRWPASSDSVRPVLVLLLLAGPAALAATALGGWWLARKALLPVERMTSQAEEIGIDRLTSASPSRARRTSRPPRRHAQRDARPPRARRQGTSTG